MADNNAEKGLNDSKVRIITKNDIRYEGTLYQINSNEKTIALKDVVSYGTEDRTTKKSIPPSDFIYEIIVFRSCEIKNLIVLKKEEDKKESGEVVKEEENNNEREVKETENNEVEENNKKEELKKKEKEVDRKVEQKKEKVQRKEEEEKDSEDVFVFKNMLAKFKEIENKKVVDNQNVSNYKKDDFFDTLTTSVNKIKTGKRDVYHDRNVTKETFGTIPENEKRNYGNRNYRGRGRNNYRGRGRNNYNKNYDHNRNYNNNDGQGYRGGNNYRNNRNFKKNNYQSRNYNDEKQHEYVRKTD